jgi:hypothetical protein
METFLDMQEELIERLMAAAQSSLFPQDRIKKLLQNAYTWAKQLYNWDELESARDSVSQIGYEYYDYPDDFRTNSLGEYLFFNGKSYKHKNFRDYIEYKRLYPSSTKRIYAEHDRKYFISPTPTVVAQITIWGQKLGSQLVNDGDKTIFSLHDESGNEAVVERAFSKAMKRIDATLSKDANDEAVRLLTILFKRQEEGKQTEQNLNKPMFDVPNFFPGNQGSFIAGNFGVDLGGDE